MVEKDIFTVTGRPASKFCGVRIFVFETLWVRRYFFFDSSYEVAGLRSEKLFIV